MRSDLNPRLIRAKWILDYFPSEKLPSFAADALEAGYDGPNLRRVAGFLKPNHWELQPHLEKMWAELDVPVLSKGDSLVELLKDVARQIIAHPDQALSIAKELWKVCYKHDWDKRIWFFLEAEEYRPTFYTDEQATQRLVEVSKLFLSGEPIPPGRSEIAARKYQRSPRRWYFRARVWIRRKLGFS